MPVSKKLKTSEKGDTEYEKIAEIFNIANEASVVQNIDDYIPKRLLLVIQEYKSMLGVAELGLLLPFLSITSFFG